MALDGRYGGSGRKVPGKVGGKKRNEALSEYHAVVGRESVREACEETMRLKYAGGATGWRAAIRLSLGSVLLAGLSLAGFLVVSGTGPAGVAQSSSAAPAGERKTSPPYTGDLSIFETPGRDERLHTDRVLDLLEIAPGKNVADIGAGSGWFTVRAARRVTGSGTVYAVDINPEAIRFIDQRAKKEQLRNVRTILSEPDDPRLPGNSVDAVLLLKTYHEIAHPVVFLQNLRASLRAGATVGVIDRNGNGADHGVGQEVVIREAAQAGYERRDTQDFVKADGVDYFLIFTVKPN